MVWIKRAAWALLAVSTLAFGAEEASNEPITAVYKAQELSFQYRSSNRFYPCHELEHRVAVILVAVGARDDISVKARNCDAFMIDNDNNIDEGQAHPQQQPLRFWGAVGGMPFSAAASIRSTGNRCRSFRAAT